MWLICSRQQGGGTNVAESSSHLGERAAQLIGNRLELVHHLQLMPLLLQLLVRQVLRSGGARVGGWVGRHGGSRAVRGWSPVERWP